MNINYFNYNGKLFYVGTIIKINENYRKHCGFNSILKFTGYNVVDDLYYFTSLYDIWMVYKLSNTQIQLYIEEIVSESNVLLIDNDKINPNYIDGIVSAWIWYLLIMFFAIFIKGIENILLTWIVASYIFFTWRYNKIKGG